jgi:hypothetical protein
MPENSDKALESWASRPSQAYHSSRRSVVCEQYTAGLWNVKDITREPAECLVHLPPFAASREAGQGPRPRSNSCRARRAGRPSRMGPGTPLRPTGGLGWSRDRSPELGPSLEGEAVSQFPATGRRIRRAPNGVQSSGPHRRGGELYEGSQLR